MAGEAGGAKKAEACAWGSARRRARESPLYVRIEAGIRDARQRAPRCARVINFSPRFTHGRDAQSDSRFGSRGNEGPPEDSLTYGALYVSLSERGNR